ncbi:FAD-binding domain-containing protein [Zopfia rhizophila CBS 207.26]|uniref:FAD-binding domain-containing protein n=1 Tax=Zopfia rhizophila CBS 207.26 TaxID=1314779 RepID=A0A6A6DJP5_9PEZI|nr:FAD-binding domain-containing protein [Zopfia rhizophila CBS 207.26]
MAPNKLSAGVVTALLFSVSVSAIEQAAAVTSESVSGAELFDYETTQLTDEVLQQLAESNSTAEYANLVSFDNGSEDSDALARRSGSCKSFPGDASWPKEMVWNIFDFLTGGALIPTIPIAAPCYKNWNNYDAGKCASIISKFPDPYFHEADPTSIAWPIFQGKTCLPINSPNGTCTLGGYPAYAVNVTNVAQVQLAVNFARNLNIRLVIKNTGHCYLGKSSGAGSLSIWMHNMKIIKYLPNYKGPGYSGPAMKVGAGVTVKELYQAAEDAGVTATGGICESVGYAGGYIQGGGHTPMSGLYGMAADNVMALEVVTADGRFVTATEDSYPDLYWALRGGGGSTYGVVTSVITCVFPKMPIVTSTWTIATGGNVTKDMYWEAVRTYFDLLIPFTDAHTYSYFWAYNRNNTNTFQMMPFFAPNYTIDQFNELVEPLYGKIRSLGIPFSPKTVQHDSFFSAYKANWGNDTVGTWISLPGNWLFPRGNWEDPAKFDLTFDAIKAHSEAGRTFGGYHQAPRNRMNVDNAVSSAFRNVISFLIGATLVPENATPAQMKNASDFLTNSVIKPWEDVAPTSEFGGSYLNEANVMQPNWQEAFYGVQYPRLLMLKKKYDPRGVFYATTAVGSEEWVVEDGDQGVQTQNGRLCRV